MYELVIFLAGGLTASVAAFLLLLPRLRRSEAVAAAREVQLAELRARLASAAPAGPHNAEAATIAAQNAELRRRMDELADAILARAGHPAPPPPLRPTGR